MMWRGLVPARVPSCKRLQVVVSGLHTNNTANILGSFPVCNSTVYITDLVLLPADSLQGIPQAPAVQSPTRAGVDQSLIFALHTLRKDRSCGVLALGN